MGVLISLCQPEIDDIDQSLRKGEMGGYKGKGLTLVDPIPIMKLSGLISRWM
jgi:hypothetical protein